MFRSLLASVLLTLSSFHALAQSTLDSPPPWGNSQVGIIFDVIASNDVNITGFSIYPYRDMTNTPFEVYTRRGTSAGFEEDAAEWTLIGSANVTMGQSELARIPLEINTPIAAGATQAFYITSTNGDEIRYRQGDSAIGSIVVEDANISLRSGGPSMRYPFTLSSRDRAFVGAIHYDLNTQAPTSATPVPTLGAFGLIGLAGAIGAAGIAMNRRRRQ